MRVSKVLDPASNAVSYTVVGVAGVVEPAERYLRYLAETERSPNTVKAHAHDLKDWFVFLDEYGLDWQSVKLEDVGAFIRWLRRPPEMRGQVFSVLPTIGHHCGEATVNRKLSTVSIFYQHAARHGLDLGELVTCWDPYARQGGWKPFLHHISKGAAKQRRVVKLPVTARIPRLLAPDEVQSILDSCEHLRDRLLFALLHDAGIRIGEALGLRHEDIAVAEREITVRRRDNTNGARAKSPHSRTVPVTAELIRLYADYLDVEYGDLDSDYVFVNLWGRPYGQAMTYAAVHDLVRRIRRQTGIGFGPLGIAARSQVTVHFENITRPWLKQLAKRWARWRLTTGLTVESAVLGTKAVESFNAFLDSTRIPVTGTADIDREVIEGFLAYLHTHTAGTTTHRMRIGQFNTLLLTMRRHGWVTDLPSTAQIYTEDYPKETVRQPRALSEHVMAQLENPENVAKMASPHHRLITVILIRCGLRISDTVALTQDCITRDKDGAPYLRYLNHKMKREALVPIDEELERAIAEHILYVSGTGNSGTRQLFAHDRVDVYGAGHLSPSSYSTALRRWVRDCNVTDENGTPAVVSPHRFRHTLGTRLINLDVPQEVVRRILDHDSHQMTAHYARLSDTTIRRHWEAARKVNATGSVVELDPDGPLAEAAWSKQRLGRATQALPNGYCGLPVQKTCPHANACLTCPMFITTADFLPQHREHRTQVVQILSAAEARGQQRLVEMNTRVLGNLDRIIATLDDETPENPSLLQEEDNLAGR